MRKINIIGAGLAGLSAAIHLAQEGIACRLISLQPSERAQSVMAEGGINAALNTMGEEDTVEQHFADTVRGGAYLADENAVQGLTEHAPEIVRRLCSIGVPFNRKGQELVLRNFGGQKKKRTAYSKSSTGKILMSALIDEARKYEAKGLIKRYPHHCLTSLIIENNACIGVEITDLYTGNEGKLYGAVILASGGMNSLFPEMTTGTAVNTGDATAIAFSQGVELANLEFIQYHPTTAAIAGKRMLISEAARGEGGRLYVWENNQPYYFMEEKYPELGNLMPRDVISREMIKTGKQVYLEMAGIPSEAWSRLSDLRDECIRLLGVDPHGCAIEVSPGIHYFMGGIYVDEKHRTSLSGLFAAGECACQYHGANRLGGNSMLGAIYGGSVAAESASAYIGNSAVKEPEWNEKHQSRLLNDYAVNDEVAKILRDALGIFRTEETLVKALNDLNTLDSSGYSENDKKRLEVAKAMVMSALNRKESRGAHTRTDYPETSEAFQKTTVVQYQNGNITLSMRDIARRVAE
ncbi:MAG: FAD-binding protein [Eubacterium sp.]|nr:FAD-binding protein [Eubacterium sp.]